MSRDSTYVRLIHTERWLRLRKAKLQSSPCCEECARAGLSIAATEVHHRTPVEFGLNASEKERLMFDSANLVSLCHACHVQAHRDLGRSGRERTRTLNSIQRSRALRKLYGERGEGVFSGGEGSLPTSPALFSTREEKSDPDGAHTRKP